MKATHGRGCIDSSLTRQVEQLLSDAALQEYTATFTPGRERREYGPDFTPGFLSKFQNHTNGFAPDRTSSAGAPKKNANSSVPASPAQEHASVRATVSPVVSAGDEDEDEDEKLRFRDPAIKVKSSHEQTRPSPPPPSSSPRVSPSRRLSSPEKIINLHEQLQKTMSSYQVQYRKANASCTQVSVGGV